MAFESHKEVVLRAGKKGALRLPVQKSGVPKPREYHLTARGGGAKDVAKDEAKDIEPETASSAASPAADAASPAADTASPAADAASPAADAASPAADAASAVAPEVTVERHAASPHLEPGSPPPETSGASETAGNAGAAVETPGAPELETAKVQQPGVGERTAPEEAPPVPAGEEIEAEEAPSVPEWEQYVGEQIGPENARPVAGEGAPPPPVGGEQGDLQGEERTAPDWLPTSVPPSPTQRDFVVGYAGVIIGHYRSSRRVSNRTALKRIARELRQRIDDFDPSELELFKPVPIHVERLDKVPEREESFTWFADETQPA